MDISFILVTIFEDDSSFAICAIILAVQCALVLTFVTDYLFIHSSPKITGRPLINLTYCSVLPICMCVSCKVHLVQDFMWYCVAVLFRFKK